MISFTEITVQQSSINVHVHIHIHRSKQWLQNVVLFLGLDGKIKSSDGFKKHAKNKRMCRY